MTFYTIDLNVNVMHAQVKHKDCKTVKSCFNYLLFTREMSKIQGCREGTNKCMNKDKSCKHS